MSCCLLSLAPSPTDRKACRREVGFLADKRRTNVAITRARRHICIIGDSTTLSHDEFLGRMSDYFQEHGDYRTPADL